MKTSPPALLRRRLSPTALPLLLLPALLLSTGCQSISILDAGNLQRPALDFKARGARLQQGALASQIETGRSDGAGVAAGGCASCQ